MLVKNSFVKWVSWGGREQKKLSTHKLKNDATDKLHPCKSKIPQNKSQEQQESKSQQTDYLLFGFQKNHLLKALIGDILRFDHWWCWCLLQTIYTDPCCQIEAIDDGKTAPASPAW